MCSLIIIALLLFIIINFKWGVVATPFLQFGMYSSVFHVSDTQTVYQLEVNGSRIKNSNLSLTSRDLLQIFPEYFERQKMINEAAYTTMKRYINYTGFLHYMDTEKYLNNINDSIFTNLYKIKVEKITGSNVHALKLYKQQFVWNKNKLEPFGTATKIIEFGTQ